VATAWLPSRSDAVAQSRSPALARAARACGGDDLFGVDSLHADRGRAEVGVLALDDVDRDPLAGEFQRVGVAQLVRGGWEWPELAAAAGAVRLRSRVFVTHMVRAGGAEVEALERTTHALALERRAP